MSPYDELARLGIATVYEAAGRAGLVDADLHRIVPGSSAAGPARTVRCGQGDNLMVHAAMAEVAPGDVLVLTMPEPAPFALFGDLLATQASEQGAAAVLVDAAVRDVEDLAELGLPVWARCIRVRGATKQASGRSTCRSSSAARRSAPGDVVVLDGDGAAVVPADGVTTVLDAAHEREAREAVKREQLQAGGLSYDLDGLRAIVEAHERHRPPRARRAPHPEARGEPRVLPRRAGHGDRGARRAGRCTCAAGATTSPTRSSSPRRRRRASPRWRSARATPRRSSGASPRSRRPGSARAGPTATAAAGASYRFRDPDGHAFELYYECERYAPPAELRPVAEEPAPALRRPRRGGQAARPRQRAGRRRPRQPRVRERDARLPPPRADRARRRHRGRRMAERRRSPPTS